MAKNKNRSTIVAVATPPGRGGVGMVRLSGPDARAILSRWVPGEFSSHHLRYAVLRHRGRVLDDVLAVWMQAPHSYTGEDVVEIFAHGNPSILTEIVHAALEEGAKAAGPGEFTRRAYLNGRLDLVQAEAVAELIHAESQAEVDAARGRLEGRLSERIAALYDAWLDVLAECEADVDFPDENLPLSDRPHLAASLSKLKRDMAELVASYDAQKKLNDGFTIAFVGAPNAGKSSLFNALLRNDRAIVTEIPGTTRDVLREELEIAGRKIRVLDTAGLRDRTEDPIEKIGMDRTQAVLANADLVLWVVSTQDPDPLLEVPAGRTWKLWNKCDLALPPRGAEGLRSFQVSAKTQQGIESLRQALSEEVVRQTPALEGGTIANDRQRDWLVTAQSALDRGWQAWQTETSAEFVAFEFREGVRALADLLGRVDPTEDTLDRIFKTFCIGK